MQNIKKSFPTILIRLTLITVLVVVAIGLTPPQVALAADISVDTFVDDFGTNSSSCSLREAIQSANTDTAFGGCSAGSGADTITLQAGTYTLSIAGSGEDSNATGDLDITSEIIINGFGPNSVNTIIQAGTDVTNGIDRVLHVRTALPLLIGNLTLNTVTVQYGREPDSTRGGGIYNDVSTLVVNNSTISNNQVLGTGVGGGIASNGNSSISNSTIANNTARNGGGMYILAATTTDLNNVTISGNIATNQGGGGYISGTNGAILNLNHVTIVNNSDNSTGDGIYF